MAQEAAMPIKIRLAQMQEFDRARLPGFGDYIVNHFETFTPVHAKTLGEAGLRKLAEDGLIRAQAYGFTKTRSAGFFVELLIALGISFDSDPQYPWAREILNDTSIPDELERADALWEKLMEFLRQTRGPNQKFVVNTLRRAKLQDLPINSFSLDDYQVRLKENFESIYPEKHNFVGPEIVEKIIDGAVEQSNRYGLSDTKGICLFAIMHFAMGSGFAQDPKFPWIGETLTKHAGEPMKCIEKLTKKLRIYLNLVLTDLESESGG